MDEWVEFCPSCSLSLFFSFFRCPDSGGISSSLCLALSVKLPSGERHRILVMIRQEIGAGNGLVSSSTRASPEFSLYRSIFAPWELSPGNMVVLFRSVEILQKIRASCWSFTCVMTWLRTPYLKHTMIPGSVALVSFSWTPSFPEMGYHWPATCVMTSLKAPFWTSSRDDTVDTNVFAQQSWIISRLITYMWYQD